MTVAPVLSESAQPENEILRRRVRVASLQNERRSAAAVVQPVAMISASNQDPVSMTSAQGLSANAATAAPTHSFASRFGAAATSAMASMPSSASASQPAIVVLDRRSVR